MGKLTYFGKMMNDLTPDEAGFPDKAGNQRLPISPRTPGSPKTPKSPKTPSYKRSPESPRSPDSPRTPISRRSRFLEIPISPTPVSPRPESPWRPVSPMSLLGEFNRTSWSVKPAKKARCNC